MILTEYVSGHHTTCDDCGDDVRPSDPVWGLTDPRTAVYREVCATCMTDYPFADVSEYIDP